MQFGLINLASGDWGDLPNSYNTLSGTGRAQSRRRADRRRSSRVSTWARESTAKSMASPRPTRWATTSLGAPDDGVVILSDNGKLQPGANTLQVTVTGIGGILNGWIDWNNNGQFEDSEHLVFTYSLGTSNQADLNPGAHQLTITAPANMAGGPLAARFRWGEGEPRPHRPGPIRRSRGLFPRQFHRRLRGRLQLGRLRRPARLRPLEVHVRLHGTKSAGRRKQQRRNRPRRLHHLEE